MSIAKPLHLRCFLEGEEIPVVAAQVTINTNGPSTAAIQIVPMDEAMDLKPRTMVHLVFLDEKSDAQTSQISIKGNSFTIRGAYRLLFPGEAIGVSIVKSALSRGMVLQCVDHSNYWDSAHATAMEYGPSGNAFTNQGSLNGGDTSLFDDIVEQQANMLVSWIKQTPRTPGLRSVTGLAGGVIRVMEAMGGVLKEHRGVNDFFTMAELRCRLLQQVAAEENDNTAYNLLKGKVFDEWIRNGLQNIGQQVTFRDMMLLLFKYIYYEFVPNPVAKFDRFVEGKHKTVSTKLMKLGETLNGISAKADLESAILKMTDIYDFTDATVRERAQSAITLCGKASAKLKQERSASKSLASDIANVQSKIDRALSQLKPILVTAPSNLKTVLDSPKSTIKDASDLIANGQAQTKERKVTTDSKSQRLKTQIIRPDCWFSAPPKCNVIFPEQYTQLSYDRNWVAECTRTLIQVYNTLVGPDALLSDKILAPPIALAAKSVIKYTGGKTYRILMDHELHTGIIPRSEWIPNTMAVGPRADGHDKSKIKKERLTWAQKASLFHFFKFRFASRQASVSGRFNPFVVCGFPAVIIQQPLMLPPSTIAETDTRTLTDNIYDIAEANGVKIPTQLIGMIAGVTHNLDQNGGTTSISMHHVRRHTGVDDEFLDLYINNSKTVNRTVKVVLTKELAAQDSKILKFLINATPQGAVSTKKTVKKRKVVTSQTSSQKSKINPSTGQQETVTTTSTRQSMSEQSVDQNVAPDFTHYSSIPVADKDNVLVPSPSGPVVKVGSKKGWYGGEILAIEVLNNGTYSTDNGKRYFDAIAVYEKVSVTRSGPLPFEEMIRPSWFSPSYSNANIGKNIYDPFFGCGSVVDEITVKGIAPAEVNFASDDPSPETVDPATSKDALKKKLADEESKGGMVSVDRAVTVLSYIYGRVKQQGLDVDEFIRSYIDRPIATLDEVLGSPDLEVKVTGTQMEVTSGTLGFHSTAVNRTLVNAGNFVGLLDTPEEQLPRINKQGKSTSMPPPYDVRAAKKQKVLEYVYALEKGPGIRG